MRRVCTALLAVAALVAGCNQPFEPVGPTDRKLVLYGIMNALADTQYVRVESTFGASAGPAVTNASVTLQGNGASVTFRDTTVLWRDTLGRPTPTNVYVAYRAPLSPGAQYTLSASTPGGLAASASFTAMHAPTIALQSYSTQGYFVLNTVYKENTGAAAVHFYLDYYVLQGDAWSLRTEEVPVFQNVGANDSVTSLVMPLTPVPTLIAGGTQMLIDSTLFQQTRSRVLKRYAPAPVVYLDIRFTQTQIDQALYDYYFVSNGPVDLLTIRLDVPDYTNVTGGYGVCGVRAERGLIFPLDR